MVQKCRKQRVVDVKSEKEKRSGKSDEDRHSFYIDHTLDIAPTHLQPVSQSAMRSSVPLLQDKGEGGKK
jgi:hypothetical protein